MKETITIYGTEVDRAELAATLKDAEMNSYRNHNFDYCVILDTETGELETDLYMQNSCSERVWKGLDVVLWTTNNRYFSAFYDWFADGIISDEETNKFVRDAIGEEAYAAVEAAAAEEEEQPWFYARLDYSNVLDSAVVDQYGEELLWYFDPEEIISEIERRAKQEAEWEAEQEAERAAYAW